MILDDIIKKRKIQLQREKSEISPDKIKTMALSVCEDTRSFKNSLSGSGISIIAEVKKSSPSKSIICSDFRPVEIATDYEKSGADAVSCLTEEYYFNGSIEYLSEIRKKIKIKGYSIPEIIILPLDDYNDMSADDKIFYTN